MVRSLTWGLVVATYNREKILPTCLKLAVNQTRPPSEIIIVDASDQWEETRDRISTEIAAYHPQICWAYVAAHTRSSTHQRNQGIRLATADVLFLFDDDTFMYPMCAEEIMRVYEADPEERVKGVQAAAMDVPPSELQVSDTKKKVGWSTQQVSRLGAIQRLLWKHLLLMDMDQLWIPYDRDYPNREIPTAVQQLDTHPVHIMAGYRMTFRREVLLAEPFEPLLLYYAMAEDADASYRISRHGALVEADNAKAHHFNSGSGRLSRYQVSALSGLNQALFLRKNSDHLIRSQVQFYQLISRRLVAEWLKDTLSRRWSLPQVRGLLTALRYSLPIFTMKIEQLKAWYPSLQRKLLQQ